MKQEILNLDNLNVNQLSELSQFENSQKELVEQNPFIEIIDNPTYEEGKKRRTALLKGRTSLENQDKVIASKLSNFRKSVSEKTKELINITLPHEEKQQEEVKRYEQIKENERIEKQRLENERIERIKKKISDFESNAYEEINNWGVGVLCDPETANQFVEDLNYNFMEFDILYQQAKLRVKEHAKIKFNSIQEKENQRIENERLAREKEEADAKLEAIQKQQEKERLEREEKERKETAERQERERKEKDQVFEIRKNRLAEIGMACIKNKFIHADEVLEIELNKVYHADLIDFENILSDAKNSIQEAKENYEKQQAEKEAREKAEIEAKKKADKENKERVKRLAKDKAIYKKVLNDTLGSFPIVFDADQLEIREFSELASQRVEDLKNQLLTELENL